MNNMKGELLPNVKTIDLEAPVDTRLEFAMLAAYGKGLEDGKKKLEDTFIDVDAEVIEDNEE